MIRAFGLAFLVSLVADAGASDAGVTDYAPLARLHELAMREAAAYREPVAEAFVPCPATWGRMTMAEIEADGGEIVTNVSAWMANTHFSWRTYRVGDGASCAILDYPDRRVLAPAELRQFLEDQAALYRRPPEPPEPAQEVVVSPEDADLAMPVEPAPSAADVREDARRSGLAMEVRKQWPLPIPPAAQRRWWVVAVRDAAGNELPLPDFDAELVFEARGFGWYDGCNHIAIELGSRPSTVSTLGGCVGRYRLRLDRVSDFQLDGDRLTLREVGNGGSFVFVPYPYSPLSERPWALRRITGPEAFDLQPFRSIMQPRLVVQADRTFAFTDIDQQYVFRGTLVVEGKRIRGMALDRDSAATAANSDEGTFDYPMYDERSGPFRKAGPRALVGRIDFPAVRGWHVATETLDGQERAILVLEAGAATYEFD